MVPEIATRSNTSVPFSTYTAPPDPCTRAAAAEIMYPAEPGRRDRRPSAQTTRLPRAATRQGGAVREPEGSRRCARVGDRHAVEHERALGHVHRPSGVSLRTGLPL